MTVPHHILILDDEPNIGSSLRLILEGAGYRVTVCDSAARLRALGRHIRPHLYLLDVTLPDGNGIDILRELRDADESVPVIMISGHATIRDAVDATRSGAMDFLEKPLARDRVLVAVKNALERSDLFRENQRFREIVGEGPRLIGKSPALLHVLDQATRVARSDASVLLMGESGTGKELLAAHVHRNSRVGNGPFVKVNCAAIPSELIESELFGHEKGAFTSASSARRGRFELADGGTIFLDEIGDLHETVQAKLLRVLQDGEVQRLGSEQTFRVAVRVISATNRNLEQLIHERRFRDDLYYRLGVVPIRLPALRERLDDLDELVSHFLAEFCARNNMKPRRIGKDVVGLLARYHWPGNVRELRNVVERMAILSPHETIDAGSVPFEIRDARQQPGGLLQDARDSAERDRIRLALEQTNWNVAGAARLLGTERTNLHKRIRALGLKRNGGTA